MIFELINPSDKCTFEAPNLKIAALVTCVLGNGQYCAKGIENDLDVPFRGGSGNLNNTYK
ncbi:hypothetical protein [Acinetobacter pittii]|uniref:Uncharacterized protein n=1 Tax=Acinetobacter pittii TaxID=48296 RepID=A0A6S4UMI5_ACIPI|nr:hypothetical protein [Acinetobacter pittii]BBQ49868.1 hypothetical protein WP2W18E11_28660 [Acinetobacter pittii]